jgi:hypothetical protein
LRAGRRDPVEAVRAEPVGRADRPPHASCRLNRRSAAPPARQRTCL